jgi:hypothetical protein
MDSLKNPKNLRELFDEYEKEARLERHRNSLLGILKELYGGSDIFKDLVYKSNPFLEMIKKHEKHKK